jgi:hypothetical protein
VGPDRATSARRVDPHPGLTIAETAGTAAPISAAVAMTLTEWRSSRHAGPGGQVGGIGVGFNANSARAGHGLAGSIDRFELTAPAITGQEIAPGAIPRLSRLALSSLCRWCDPARGQDFLQLVAELLRRDGFDHITVDTKSSMHDLAGGA